MYLSTRNMVQGKLLVCLIKYHTMQKCGEWWYRPTPLQLRLWVEVSGQLHASVTLLPAKEPPVAEGLDAISWMKTLDHVEYERPRSPRPKCSHNPDSQAQQII
jgi:hypothetical protein